MNTKKLPVLLLAVAMSLSSMGKQKVSEPAPFGALPSADQLKWHEMETYAFLHFSINTYTDEEWGFGNESAQLFNPIKLDARQWARTCKEAGMKGIMITAKHHCGFCLWPSKYTDYSVKSSPWKDGKGDVLRELSDACKEYGLKFGVYLSPWDRNHSEYARPEYITYFHNQLREILGNYGDVFEVWFDGANGGTGYYGGANEERSIDHKTYYRWNETYSLIRSLQPHTMIWGDNADLRWIGNERGTAGNPNWATFSTTFDITIPMRQNGVPQGETWSPGECDVSIQNGWFTTQKRDSRPKTLAHLMDIYYKSVGRNASLLLNFPVTTDGLIATADSLRGAQFAQAVNKVFAHNLAAKAKVKASTVRGKSKQFAAKNVTDNDLNTYWSTDDNITTGTLTIDLGKQQNINRFVVQEHIRLGQRVKKFALEALVDGKWQPLRDELIPESEGDGLQTIGYKRIVCFPTVRTRMIRFSVKDAYACPLISNIGVYYADKIEQEVQTDAHLVEPFNIKMLNDTTIQADFGAPVAATSFGYLPPQQTKEGVITNYLLQCSTDGKSWNEVQKGEFSNIENNPMQQTIVFSAPLKARYFKLQALKTINNTKAGFSKIYITK